MKIPNRVTEEAKVLSGYRYGNEFTFRLDHIALILLPLALWYDRVHSWYNIVEQLLFLMIVGFVFCVYGVALLMIWMLSQELGKLKVVSPKAFAPEGEGPPKNQWLPTEGWMSKPDMLLTSLIAYGGWMYALLQEDMTTMASLLTIGCILFPVAGRMGQNIVKQVNGEQE